MPGLFDPFQQKEVTLRNRIVVSPMCQYSSEDGHPNDWHLVHLGSRAVGGAGLVFVEATAVSPEGRITHADSGIYSDDHVEGFARLASVIKQNGAAAGMQLAHAGRKASAHKPWEGGAHIPTGEPGGWDTIAPSALAFGGSLDKTPGEMSVADIQRVQQDFVDAARRTLDAGFDVLQLHFAHGYLAHEFYSPLANHRTDEYGGSFENRTRFLRETLSSVREVWPERLPLYARLSVTDWRPDGVTLEESVELARLLSAGGLDLLDVSHGMVIPNTGDVPWGPGFMLPYAEQVRRRAGVPVGVSWQITEPVQAATAVSNQQTDLVILAREMLRDPYWPYHAAVALGAPEPGDLLPVQYARAVGG